MSIDLGSNPAHGGPQVSNGDIAQLLSRLYEVISFPEGGEPDWGGLLRLDPSFPSLQAELGILIERANRALDGTGVPLASTDATPIFMVPCEAPDIAFDVVRRLRSLGFYACPSTFPAVPVNQPGVRFTVTRHNTAEDVDDFVQALATAFYEANEPATVPRSREVAHAVG